MKPNTSHISKIHQQFLWIDKIILKTLTRNRNNLHLAGLKESHTWTCFRCVSYVPYTFTLGYDFLTNMTTRPEAIDSGV